MSKFLTNTVAKNSQNMFYICLFQNIRFIFFYFYEKKIAFLAAP